MNRLRMIMLSCGVNFKKRFVDIRTYTILICTICFAMWNLSGLRDLAQANNLEVTAWIFPHYLGNPTMNLVFSSLVILLYCDAPFMDSHMSQMVLRLGRIDWLIGQFLYIVISSLVYSLWLALSTIIVLVPRVYFANEWGRILYAVAREHGLTADYGVVLSLSEKMMDSFDPWKSMILSICLTWFVSVFIGVVIMCSNIIINRRAGYIVAGFFAFFSYFTAYLGIVIFGHGILWLSPLSWASIYAFDWFNNSARPDCAAAILILIVSTFMMLFISLCAFCKQDLDIRREGVL